MTVGAVKVGRWYEVDAWAEHAAQVMPDRRPPCLKIFGYRTGRCDENQRKGLPRRPGQR
jgi:hypothetical protein